MAEVKIIRRIQAVISSVRYTIEIRPAATINTGSGGGDTGERNLPNGYAGLDAEGLLLVEQVPALPLDRVSGLVGLFENVASDLGAKQNTYGKGAPNGYASLDGDALVPVTELPMVDIEPSGRGRYRYFNECISTTGDGTLSSQVGGTGAANSIVQYPYVGTAVGFGFMRQALGTTATGRAGLASVSANGYNLGRGIFIFSARVGLITASDGTNRYRIETGLSDVGVTSPPAYGVYFRYTDNVNGGRWEAVCVNNSVETAVDTEVAPNTSAFQVLEIEVNADGTSIEFRIDDAVVATITTNIPLLSVSLNAQHNVRRSLGTAALNATVLDFIGVNAEFPTR